MKLLFSNTILGVILAIFLIFFGMLGIVAGIMCIVRGKYLEAALMFAFGYILLTFRIEIEN